jgi:hypothetical protein
MKTLDIKSLIIGVLITTCVGLALGLRPAGSGIRPMVAFEPGSTVYINVLQISRLEASPMFPGRTLITTSNGGSFTSSLNIDQVIQKINDVLQ